MPPLDVSRRALLRGAAAGSAVAGLELVCSAGAAHAYDPPTIGDPYYPSYGDRTYDPLSYRVYNTYSTASGALWGTTVITAKIRTTTKIVSFDFVLPVSYVNVNGKRATVRRVSIRKYAVEGFPTLLAGQTATIQVGYLGYPGAVWRDHGSIIGLNGYIGTPGRGLVCAGEPTAGVYWHPCNDHLSQKATYVVQATTQQANETLLSGERLQPTTYPQAGWKTDTFVLRQPVASYQPLFAVGQYLMDESVGTVGTARVPVIHAVDASLSSARRSAAWSALNHDVATLQYLTGRFGPYPFATTGGVVVNGSFNVVAQEAVTRSVYRGDKVSASLVAHENAHMWFGNDVTASKWSEVTFLQEGLATLAQWDYGAARLGTASANSRMRTVWTGATAWSPQLGNPGRGREFSSVAYQRAPAAMNAIRNRIGWTAFDTALRTMLARHRFASVTIPEFQAICEEVGKKDLTGLFNAWVWSTSQPAQTTANGWA